MAIANECQPYYTPGRDLTGTASGAITGKRCLAIGGNRNSDGTLNVAHATAAGAIVGVSSYDAASGEVVGILRGGVVPITAGGTIAAGARVEVGSTGKVVTLASGVAIGMCLTGATNNNDAMIALSI
jgi:predicted RecA/RadA family phage recombinase